MKKTYRMFWILLIVLIPLLPLSGWNYSIDVSDVGFNLTQYEFCFTDIESTYLPLFLTNILGGCLLKLFGVLHIPQYIGMEFAWAAVCWYLCFLAYRLYARYQKNALILPALAFAMLLAKCNFHFFIYNTAVAFMALTGLYFLILAVNEKKSHLLFWAAAFFMLASFCKISSLLQFAVFSILFYDFYRKKEGAYFFRQICWCAAGALCSLGAGLVLMYQTCGIGTYFQMVLDMFFYAGNSNDGHTIGNMVVINLKGSVRGLLLLAALAAAAVLADKIKKGIPLLFACLVLVLLCVPLGAEQFGEYLNAVALIKAMIYVGAVLIFLQREASEEYKVLALASAALAILMPIGSNVGITHICNEAFFVLPYIAICVGDRLKKADAAYAGRLLTLVCIVWCTILVGSQSLYMSKAYWENNHQKQQFSLAQLRGIKYDTAIVEPLEEVTAFLSNYDGEQKMVTCGAIPLLHYLTGRAPYLRGCGGWMETDYITADEIKEQLEASAADDADMPLLVFHKDANPDTSDKTKVVYGFAENYDYQQVFANDTYKVYAKE